MFKKRDELIERRKFIRINVPIDVTYARPGENTLHKSITKDISPEGVRFETELASLQKSDPLDLVLKIPDAPNPVHARGRIAWKKKLSLADDSPYDMGVGFEKIEEDNKNTFLKFLCDVIYNSTKEKRHGRKKD